MEDKKRRSKRYSLHTKVKKEGYRLDAKHKTIYVEHYKSANLSKNVLTLRDVYGYAVQTDIV